VATVTSDGPATVGNVVNEVERHYGDLGRLAKEYQEHSGAVDGSTLYVECGYGGTEVSDELTKGLRPTSVRYPNGRLVHYTYGTSGGAADKLGRLEAIKDDSAGSPGRCAPAAEQLPPPPLAAPPGSRPVDLM